MSTFSPLLTAVVISFVFSFSIGDDNCRWLFDNCSRLDGDSPCVVRLRLWCICGKNASCGTNSTREANTTAARSMIGAVDSYCNVSSCAVVPRQCEWTPWNIYLNHCIIQRFERFRSSCCDPVYLSQALTTSHNAVLNASCSQKLQREMKSQVRIRKDCFQLPDKLRPTQPPNQLDENAVDFSGWKRYEFALCGLLLFLLIPLAAGAERWKRRRRGLSGRPGRPGRESPPIVIDLGEELGRPLPKNAVIPQPGQPLSQTQPML